MIVKTKRWSACTVVVLFAACSPALDWREIRPADSGLTALFPCKPQRFARQVTLAGANVKMHLTSCSAGDVTYAVGYALLSDPAKVTAALDALRHAAADNIHAQPAAGRPWSVPGMTPNLRAERLAFAGRDTKGATVVEQVAFFVKGLRVYQATVLGPRIDAEAADTFFDSLTLAP